MDENIMNEVPENEVVNPVEGDVLVSEEQQKSYYDETQTQASYNADSSSQFSQASPEAQGNGSQPGKGAAVASLVLGIVSIVFWVFGIGAVVGLVTGIIGLICSSNSKKQGFSGGMQTAGFVCSLIGLIGSALIFVACLACVGAAGTAGLLSGL